MNPKYAGRGIVQDAQNSIDQHWADLINEFDVTNEGFITSSNINVHEERLEQLCQSGDICSSIV